VGDRARKCLVPAGDHSRYVCSWRVTNKRLEHRLARVAVVQVAMVHVQSLWIVSFRLTDIIIYVVVLVLILDCCVWLCTWHPNDDPSNRSRSFSPFLFKITISLSTTVSTNNNDAHRFSRMSLGNLRLFFLGLAVCKGLQLQCNLVITKRFLRHHQKQHPSSNAMDISYF
jgi:hypothetical protein